MKFTTKYIVILLVILVGLGIFLYQLNEITRRQAAAEEAGEAATEGFDGGEAIPPGCPNLLIHRGDVIVLYNTRVAQAGTEGTGAGTHVVAVFKHLEEYAQYVKEQRQSGTYCPVLYLRQETSAQGKDVYRMYPAPADAGAPPMAPPFLESVPVWDLHHQPPFYVEGGLPALPIETAAPGVLRAADASRENHGPFNKDQYPGFDPYGLYVGRVTDIDQIHQSTQKTGSCSYNPADPNWCGIVDTQRAVDAGQFAGNEVIKAIYPKTQIV